MHRHPDSARIPAELLNEAIRSARMPVEGPKRMGQEVLPIVRSLALHLTIATLGYATIQAVAPKVLATARSGEVLVPIDMPVAKASKNNRAPALAPDAGMIPLAAWPEELLGSKTAIPVIALTYGVFPYGVGDGIGNECR
jgi:hypothetical protein